MSVSQVDSGTVTADGTEQTVDTISNGGVYVWAVDLSNMASGDSVTLRVKDKVLSGGSAVLAFEETYTGAQAVDWVCSEPIAAAHEITFTLEQTAGTNRQYAWSTRSVT